VINSCYIYVMNEHELKDKIEAVLLGVSIADMASLKYEFLSRDEVRRMHALSSVRKVSGGGYHGQPIGAFSDDTSLTLCLADSLCDGYDLEDIGNKMVQWYSTGLWSYNKKRPFDIGNTTKNAILRMVNGVSASHSGDHFIHASGNGSLMKILPLLFYIKDMEIEERFRLTKEVSSVSHAHNLPVIACFYYLELARLLLEGKDKFTAYHATNKLVKDYLNQLSIPEGDAEEFSRILGGRLYDLPDWDIESGGFVRETLEAALYSFLTCESFADVVVKCILLGSDTDTVAVVAGGLAALQYKDKSCIPLEWLAHLQRREDIQQLSMKYAASLLAKSK
jgi:ADP-ribosyl-[dinitrogen reductase] hydrolase